VRWFSRERRTLFSSLAQYNTDSIPSIGLGWPKLGSDVQAAVLRTMLFQPYSLGDAFVSDDGEHATVYYFKTAYNWLTATRQMPPAYDKEGNGVVQTAYGAISLPSEEDAWATLSLLTSSIAFWFWLVYGDGFHVTLGLLRALPISLAQLHGQRYDNLVKLGQMIQEEMQSHLVFKWNAGRRIGNYSLRRCRHLTCHVDAEIVEQLGLGKDCLTDILGFCEATTKTELTD